MNHNHVSATIGIKAVDPRILADDKFIKRMGNFDRVCKQIDAKYDNVMEMLADIQEQLRKLEMKQWKERGAQFQIHTTAFKPPYLPVSRPQEIEVESKILPPNQCLSSLSYGSNDAEPEIEGCVEVLKHAPTISAVVVETDFFTTRAAKIHARKVFDEIPESKKSKISVMPPLVSGSEIAEVYDFGVSNLQFQTPLVSTQEIKMELDCLSLIPSPISISPSSDDTKLEEEGSMEVPIYTIVTEWQPQEPGYGFEVSPKPTLVASKSIASIGKVEALPWPLRVSKAVKEISFINPKMMNNINSIHVILCRDVRSQDLVQWSKNFPNLSICEVIPNWRIIISSLLYSPFLYYCYNGDELTKEELKWLDTGQYLIVSDFSRDGAAFDLIVFWNLMKEMCWDKNILVSEMQLKGSSGNESYAVVKAEMFGQLTSGLESAWNKLKGEEVLTKENIVEPMRDIRRAILEADVSLPVVRRFVQAVSDQAVGTGLIRGVKPDQQLVKTVHDELVKLMGGEVSELVFSNTKPTVILLAGLQGVGQTTVSAKLAFYLKRLGKSCILIAGDVYRPAAIDQLVILGEQVGVPVYAAGTDIKPAEIARQGLNEARKKNVDVVIMDTAGRLQIDKSMMDELKEVKRVLNPTEVLLVVDAMTGQEAAALVTTFNVEIGITGAILTKLDGDSRGGAALSVKEVSGKPIKLVGRGERMEDLEPFYPDRMAGRILGMGDVLSFVEKAQEVMKQEDAEDLQKKIMSAKFDFNDFLKQTRAVARMGSMSRVLGMIPGMGKVTPAQIREAEKSLQVMESMIEAMTPEEREKPELLAESPERRKRVAQESGKTEQQVSQVVAQLFQMRVRMKNLMGVMEGGSLPTLSNLEEAMKAEQKAPPGTARRKKRAESRKQFADSSARPSPRGFGAKN